MWVKSVEEEKKKKDMGQREKEQVSRESKEIMNEEKESAVN